MSDFPDAIDTFRTVENLPGLVYNELDTKTLFAEDINNLTSAVIALETYSELKPEVLYENNTGVNTTITLSHTSADYSYLEIYYFDNISNGYNSNKIYSPNGKKTTLNNFEYGDGAAYSYLYHTHANVSISGTSITWNHNGYTLGAANYNDPRTKITRVLGFK